jgi:NAD(P)-dependent dehydrogenase (short-subunit alcohol dehydrogenase family)
MELASLAGAGNMQMGNFIVTGGRGALGRAVVEALAEGGGRVAIIDRGPHAPLAGTALVVGEVDLADQAKVEAAFARIAAELGPIDGLANIAGGFTWQTVAKGAIEGFDAMYQTNLRTVAATCRAVLPHLSDGGGIVNVGAASAARPGVGLAAYAASKAGVMALTMSLAEELRARRVRVNAVLPTTLDTPANRRDMPDADTSQWVRPEAAAKVIAFLLSPEAGPVTGAGIPLSLG